MGCVIMGKNIDLNEFGMNVNCPVCKNGIDVSEVDMDCDISPMGSMCFELKVQCPRCEKNSEILFDICERHDSE